MSTSVAQLIDTVGMFVSVRIDRGYVYVCASVWVYMVLFDCYHTAVPAA